MPSIRCEHNLDGDAAVLSDQAFLAHFQICLTEGEQEAQLLQWRDAARKWWDHQEREFQRGNRVEPEPEKLEHPPIDVESKDMCVHVVLPGGAVLTLAADEPPTSQMLEPFSDRDRQLMATLLRVAQNELMPPFEYYGPMPVVPAPPRPVKP